MPCTCTASCAKAISNTIRHATRHRTRAVRIPPANSCSTLTDDGSGVPAAVLASSSMRNMRTRAGELGGRIDWAPGTEAGAKVLAAHAAGSWKRERRAGVFPRALVVDDLADVRAWLADALRQAFPEISEVEAAGSGEGMAKIESAAAGDGADRTALGPG